MYTVPKIIDVPTRYHVEYVEYLDALFLWCLELHMLQAFDELWLNLNSVPYFLV